MPARSIRRPLVAAFAGAALLFGAFGFGCAIDLSDALAGRPCKDGECLPEYYCSAMNTCLRRNTASTGGTDAAMIDANGAATGGDGAAGLGGGGAGGAQPASDGSLDGPSLLPDAPSGTSDGTTGGTGGTDGGTVPLGGVACRDFRCDSDQSCCVASFPGFPTPPPATDFSCEDSGNACAFTYRCDGDHDCASDEVCCLDQSDTDWIAQCRSSCDSPAMHLECTIPAHCGSGLTCCGQWNFTTSRFSAVECADCTGPFSPDTIFCTSDNDCNNQACREAASLPGLHTCQ